MPREEGSAALCWLWSLQGASDEEKWALSRMRKRQESSFSSGASGKECSSAGALVEPSEGHVGLPTPGTVS